MRIAFVAGLGKRPELTQSKLQALFSKRLVGTTEKTKLSPIKKLSENRRLNLWVLQVASREAPISMT